MLHKGREKKRKWSPPPLPHCDGCECEGNAHFGENEENQKKEEGSKMKLEKRKQRPRGPIPFGMGEVPRRLGAVNVFVISVVVERGVAGGNKSGAEVQKIQKISARGRDKGGERGSVAVAVVGRWRGARNVTTHAPPRHPPADFFPPVSLSLLLMLPLTSCCETGT